MSLPNVDIDQLISLVQMRPVLWDKTEKKYKDRIKTQEAWKEVFIEIQSDFEHLEERTKQQFGRHVLKKWTQVRDSYRKCVAKTKAAMKSGAGADKMKTYIYATQLRFLDKIFQERSTEDSLPENVQDPVIDDNVVERDENQESSVDEPAPSGSFSAEGATKSQANEQNMFKKHTTPTTKRKFDEVELEMLAALREKPNSHISFFNGILPSIEDFDEFETLEFQMEVLKTVKSIRHRKFFGHRPTANTVNESGKRQHPPSSPPPSSGYHQVKTPQVSTTKNLAD